MDISAPDTSTFKHLRGVQIGATGQMTQIGNAKSNDPHMQDIKTLLQDMKIATSDKQAEEMLNDPQQSEGIYQFIEQRGGLNEVKRAYRNESIRPTRQPAKQPPPPVRIIYFWIGQRFNMYLIRHISIKIRQLFMLSVRLPGYLHLLHHHDHLIDQGDRCLHRHLLGGSR